MELSLEQRVEFETALGRVFDWQDTRFEEYLARIELETAFDKAVDIVGKDNVAKSLITPKE